MGLWEVVIRQTAVSVSAGEKGLQLMHTKRCHPSAAEAAPSGR